ncbi:MAG: DoxX family membrane protein [Pseudomonadota bacterium]
MTDTTLHRLLVLFLRLSLGWVFLYAGVRQVMNPAWSAAQFLAGAKTFPEFYAFFLSPGVLPVVNFLTKWGHTLIGISLILGVSVRASSSFAALLMILYYFPRLEFPMVGPSNFIVEYHLIYAAIFVYLGAVRAGQIWGLENWVARLPVLRPVFHQYPKLRPWLS